MEVCYTEPTYLFGYTVFPYCAISPTLRPCLFKAHNFVASSTQRLISPHPRVAMLPLLQQYFETTGVSRVAYCVETVMSQGSDNTNKYAGEPDNSTYPHHYTLLSCYRRTRTGTIAGSVPKKKGTQVSDTIISSHHQEYIGTRSTHNTREDIITKTILSPSRCHRGRGCRQA